ncbi:MAG: valine--tRNA ligase [Desulfomonilaceae bacterium]
MTEDLLSKTFNPSEIEPKWYAYWLKNGYFSGDENKTGREYSIVIPPPNVTGSLHMGHALNNTLQDILIRYHRMNGFNTLWMPGMDHAGIATQNVVERQLAQEGLTRNDLGRENFIERVWEWKEHSGGVIINQLKRLGCSCDWDRQRFTMDKGLSKAVREVFVKLYEEGLIYKGDYIVNWCPRCHTALSDLEVEHHETQGSLWHIKYQIEDSDEFLVVATTRPETMLGDTAVAVNPADPRYSAYIGKHAILPIVGRKLRIIADPIVAMDFGTGALKVTPSHDLTDFELSVKHNLDRVTIMDADAKINELGLRFQGLDRYACREQIIAELQEKGFLEKITPYTVGLGKCYRCKEVVEPLISKQWFVRVEPLAKEALAAVQQGKTRIIPDHWVKTYYEWMNNIRDWCISRQIWWGHRIPAWTCQDCGEIIVSSNTPSHCTKCNSVAIRQETDVLDTWFSSALWPFSTMGWPDKSPLLETFYPTSCLVTGFDILFFWVARMMMMGIKFMGDVPFKDVYIHALVRDEYGKKMSKSLGNVIDPLMVMDKYGTDAFRFTLAALAAQGRDIRLSENRIEGYRNFVNKLWNSARFTLPHVGKIKSGERLSDFSDFSLPERWLISRLNKTIEAVKNAVESYAFNDAAQGLYEFCWHEFCDWGLEISKIPLADPDPKISSRSAMVLIHTLDSVLRLLHPFIPFVTEEIASKLASGADPIIKGPYPISDKSLIDETAEDDMGFLMAFITSTRTLRAEMNVAPNRSLPVSVVCTSADQINLIRENLPMVLNLGKISNLEISELTSASEPPPNSVTAVVSGARVYIPLSGIIDAEAEIERLNKELQKVKAEYDSVDKKLQNQNFISKAKPEAVQKQRNRQIELSTKLAGLQDALNKTLAIRNS